NDPWSHVAAEVEQQITNAIRVRVCPPPDLFVAEQLQTTLDLSQVVLGELCARANNEGLADVTHDIRTSQSVRDESPCLRSGYCPDRTLVFLFQFQFLRALLVFRFASRWARLWVGLRLRQRMTWRRKRAPNGT